ncbi:hypothetical protein DL769_004427 [Monosporascus sp. CRB-8-3]|nr:hypothetical protein DL769_004427 [Monosporascus sp. CRB-8-3]
MPLSRPNAASEATRRTIREAFENLEKTISPAESRGFENETIEGVQKAAQDIENQLAARSSLRNMRRLMPLFTGLGYYSKSIEVACNGTPYLPWLWAPIKLILKISSDYVESFDRIIKAYSQIGDCLTRFQVLSSTFNHDSTFQQTLGVFYADILRFHREAYRLLRRPYDLIRHGDLIDKAANAYHIAEARDARQKIEEWREESLAKLRRYDKEQTTNQLQAIMAWFRLDDTDQLAIFDKIAAEGSKYPGTCGWVLKNDTISSWLQSGPETPFVWLQGKPGSGKSVIAGQLVNFLRSLRKSLVIIHFCTYSYPSSTQYDKILRSMLWQALYENDDMIAYIYWEYVVPKKSASTPVLEQLFKTVIESLLGEPGTDRSVHIVLDGLNEIEVEEQRQLVTILDVSASTQSQLNQYPILASVLNDLSHELQLLTDIPHPDGDGDRARMPDDFCIPMQHYKGLQDHARAVLAGRNQKTVTAEPEITDKFSDQLRQVRNLADVLHNYQATINELLTIEEIPGVSFEELEIFKRVFRSSAYTCRLPLCPRASTGFESHKLRLEHEASHTQRICCTHAGCQYPPFTSIRALKNHETKCHQLRPVKRRLRRMTGPPASVSRRSGLDSGPARTPTNGISPGRIGGVEATAPIPWGNSPTPVRPATGRAQPSSLAQSNGALPILGQADSFDLASNPALFNAKDFELSKDYSQAFLHAGPRNGFYYEPENFTMDTNERLKRLSGYYYN